MPGRSFTSSSYRYGFNGKEQDLETLSTSTYDYGFRIYNPALGRFLSVDPLSHAYPWFTPYQFAGNTPISAIDLDGLENVFICNNDNNQGECMEVQYSAEDIADIANKKKPEFKVHYPDGRVTGQFEGPNKANENRVFQAMKPLIESSGLKVYEENIPDGVKRDFSYIRNEYEVPAPAPVRPRQPRPPVMPPMNIGFKKNSDEFKDASQVDAIVKPLADYLLKNPKANIKLSGNTGVSDGPNEPLGSGPDVLNSSSILNGKTVTTGELMKSRAEAVRTYLINKYKIDGKRISTSTGTQTKGEAGRTVGVERTN